jgi:glycosyltransferase involved in cell wall biosynthesis
VQRRIAILSANFHPVTCGVGDHSLRLASALRSRGLEVRVFTRAPAAPHPEDPAVAVETCPGASPAAFVRAAAPAILAWRATDVVVQYVPHMLGASRFGSAAVPRLCRALRRSKVGVTVFAHELYLPWSPRPDLALGAALNRVQLLATLAASDRCLVTTESRRLEVERLLRRAGASARISVVPVGSNATPVLATPRPGRFDLGTFSSRTPNKRLDVALDAFASVAERSPEARLLLIGDPGGGATAFAREFDARLRAHPAAARIVVTGNLALSEVARLVAELDVFLFAMDVGATTRSSTLPLPLGSGVPVVAFRGKETGPLFVADQTVVFADALSGAAFARAVERIRADAGLRERVARGGRALFEEQLAWTRLADRILDALPRVRA